MLTTVQQDSISDVECDVAVVNLFAGVRYPGGATGAMDSALDGAITKTIAEKGFQGKLGEPLFLPSSPNVAADNVLVIGLGLSASFGYAEVEKAAKSAVNASVKEVWANVRSPIRIATIVHGAGIGGLNLAKAVKALIDGSSAGFEESKIQGELIIVEFDQTKVETIKNCLNCQDCQDCQN